MAPYLNISGLSKSFGSQLVFSDLDLQLKSGVAAAIFGNNGCGKTTLLRMIRGLLEEDDGFIQLAEVKHGLDARAESKDIRLIEPMENGFWSDMTVTDNLLYFYEEESFSEQLGKIKLHLPIQPLLKKNYGDCSRGNKQLIHLVRGFMCSRARLYLIDEPLSFLDPHVVQSVLGYLRLQQHLQKCILISAQENYRNVLKEFSQFQLKDGVFT